MYMDPALTLPSPFFHTTFLLFSIVLLHHHHVFYCFPLPPPLQPHFYCFPSTTTTATTFQLFSFHNYWTRLSVSQTIDLLATDKSRYFAQPRPTIVNYIHRERICLALQQGRHGRISDSSLKEAVSSLDRSQLTCYICGPPPMIKHVTDILHRLNIGDSRMHFEKWW